MACSNSPDSSCVFSTCAATTSSRLIPSSSVRTSVVLPAPISPGDDDEALALVDAELQVRQRVAVSPAVEVERRVRVELERRAAEAEL